jgi:15,16-dihydrobiliverdin:ferredoxin oxidoreductase
MTYYDAGDKTQVFNSLWYPALRYDAPVIGIDLLAFNRRSDTNTTGIQGKYLSVIDFQPIHDEGNDGSSIRAFSNALGDIRDDYPSLQGKMSARFYDEKRHFSSRMLFGRGEKEDFVDAELFPAFERSMQAHLKVLRALSSSDDNVKRVLSGQASYDSYSSVRDPAMAMFTKMFGENWSRGYVYDFLFDLSNVNSVKREVDLIAKTRSSKSNELAPKDARKANAM